MLRARVAMLEARGPALHGAAPAPPAQQQPAAGGGAAAAAAVVAAQREVGELRQQLAAALEKLEGRQQSAAKYKASLGCTACCGVATFVAGELRCPLPSLAGHATCCMSVLRLAQPAPLPNDALQHPACLPLQEAVRVLKRRVAELEQQAAQQAAAAGSAAQQASAAVAAEAAKAAQAAAALASCEAELEQSRRQCEEHRGRLAEASAQLKAAQFERAQWEWRAQDAEQRAAAASEAADASSAAAARLAGRQRAQAEGRTADVEAQAKAASLRVLVSWGDGVPGLSCRAGWRAADAWPVLQSLMPAPCCVQHLEKQLHAARQEIEAVRERHQAQQAPPPPAAAAQPWQQEPQRGQEAELQQQLARLRSELAAAQQRAAGTEQLLRGKAAALAAAEKRLKQFELAVSRLAAKQGGAGAAGDFLIRAHH